MRFSNETTPTHPHYSLRTTLVPMTLLSDLRSTSSMPFAWRTLLLASVLLACLLINADYARGQTPPDDPTTEDDHGDDFDSATPLPLGYFIRGQIDPEDDIDYFSLDLSEQTDTTDIWLYSFSDFDSVGELYDSDEELISMNDDSRVSGRWLSFHFRASLEPGIYYVSTGSFKERYVGNYALFFVEVSENPSDSIESPTLLGIREPTPGKIEHRGETHYFQLDFPEHTHMYIHAESMPLYDLPISSPNEKPLHLAHLGPTIYDSEGEEVTVNVYEFGVSGFLVRDEFPPGTYLLEVTTLPDNYDHFFPLQYTIQAWPDRFYPAVIEACGNATAAIYGPSFGDPMYACQWHLDQPSGEDVNVAPVWEEGFKGEGINVAVVDTGMDWTHEDLIENVDPSLNHDYTDEGDIHDRFSHHGTNVAGLIAARDNDIGVRGVAPRATIYGYNFLDGQTESTSTNDFLMADAAGRNSGVTAISNNSWGFRDSPRPNAVPAIWELAVENGVNRGYDGKGVFYVWSAGNGHDDGDNSNLEGLSNFYAVTSACAVSEHGDRSSYSEMGANLWVCAAGGDFILDDERLVVTVENNNRYSYTFNGTSAAAPIISGVAALVRQANPTLTWRDVKLVLAESARKNDPDNEGWLDGAAAYGSDADRYHFNHEYGFGVVDAAAAVELAMTWANLPPMREASIESSMINTPIPDAYDAASIETVTLTLDLDTDIDFTEFVEINTSFQHNSFRDLDVELESPSGAVSKLTVPFNTFTDDDDPDNDYVPMRGPYRFGSARHLGEDPNGTWTLRITDRFRFGAGILESWGITVYGHSSSDAENVAPVFAAGETTSRSVAENTPAGDPVGAPITAADADALAYTLGGPDAALFNIDSASAQITVGTGTSLDYETRVDYTVTVTATDPSGETATITVNIAVTDVSLGELGDGYDDNRNERIDRDEVLQAIEDYLAGIITRDEVLEIIDIYLST